MDQPRITFEEGKEAFEATGMRATHGYLVEWVRGNPESGCGAGAVGVYRGILRVADSEENEAHALKAVFGSEYIRGYFWAFDRGIQGERAQFADPRHERFNEGAADGHELGNYYYRRSENPEIEVPDYPPASLEEASPVTA